MSLLIINGVKITDVLKLLLLLAVNTQLEATQIVTAHRYYAMLKADPTYKKRITWFTNLPDADGKAVWEYQGEQHGSNTAHSNAKLNDCRSYVRTRPEMLQRMEDAVQHRHATCTRPRFDAIPLTHDMTFGVAQKAGV